MILRKIPSTGELLPVLGLGTWQTFDVSTIHRQPDLEEVLEIMHQKGGRLIDSSPMYGRSETIVGDLTQDVPWRDELFYATKVWTSGREEGIRQMEESFGNMKRKRMDLMQIHNLTDWKTHLRTLRDWKAEGKIRYIGITHYTDNMHEELEQVFSSEKVDFVQFNYSILSRNAEKRLLQAAADHGVATIINRPLGEGSLFSKVKNKPLPSWAREYGIESWSAFFLTYIAAHPAVTCIIPATGNPAHARENFSLPDGPLPWESLRERMRRAVEGLSV